MKIVSIILLLLAATLTPVLAGPHGTTGTTVTDAFDFKSSNPWTIGMGPFNGTYGTYNESMTYFPSALNVGTTFVWSFPNAPCPSICGFSAIDYGNYQNGNTGFITARQIKNITTLSSLHNIFMSVDTNGFDVIYDFFLTSAANDNTKNVFEMEILLRSPTWAQSYFATLTPIGSFVGSGVTWSVAVDNTTTPPDILFKPTNNADVPLGPIDVKAMFSYLATQTTITGNEWFNGYAIGVEPRNGIGTYRMNSLAVTYN